MRIQDIFSSELQKEITNSGSIKNFQEGAVILDMHSYIKNIPLILSGSIKVIKTEEDGREILL